MSGRTALLAVAAATFLVAHWASAQQTASAQPAPAAQSATGDFRLLFTGDVMMSRLVKVEIDQRRTSPWRETKPGTPANPATGFYGPLPQRQSRRRQL
ncbi:MAG: hypothetical protein WDM87_15855 [Terracidiphilus sp.]